MTSIRKQYEYDEHDTITHKMNKSITLQEIGLLEHTNKCKIHDNQKQTAYDILSKISNRHIINIMVLGRTQSGKTGTMCAFIKFYLEQSDTLIPIENIYILTGLSSKSWKKQTRERIPNKIMVYHRNDMDKAFVNDIKNKRNLLILLDECHIACGSKQSIYKTLRSANMLNQQSLYDRDVKIIEFSATPNGTLYDLLRWNDASALIKSTCGDGYVSSYDLLCQNRVFPNYDLSTESTDIYEHIHTLKAVIDAFSEPMYHIIRSKLSEEYEQTIINLKQVFCDSDYEFTAYDADSTDLDINHILSTQPCKHTFIIIKEMLRCSKTLTKTYLGVLYERYCSKFDDSVVIQGLIGRLTGYDDTGKTIVFTNIPSVLKYETYWSTTDYLNTKNAWNTFHKKDTFNSPSYYENFSNELEQPNNNTLHIFKFSSFTELKMHLVEHIPNYQARELLPKDDGYYYHTLNHINKIWCTDELDHVSLVDTGPRRNITSRLRIIPCYADISDQTTLQWWLFSYNHGEA